MPLPLLALAVASFGIGTTEFVIMGLLPNVAADLGVSIPSAGMLVSGYALGVVVGAPILAILTSRLRRKTALVALMALFIVGNILCAVAPSYASLMAARIVTAFCHGTFFGIGSVVASGLVPPSQRARAIALMFAGLTLANVLGVPLGTALGQWAGWRSTFWGVVAISVLAELAIIIWVPKGGEEAPSNLLSEFRVVRRPQVLLAMGISVLASSSLFSVFTYITPILQEVTGVSPHGVTLVLLLFGVGLTIGNLLGGRLADWKLMPSVIGIFCALVPVLAAFSFTSAWFIPAVITIFVWGVLVFALVAPLQMRVVDEARGAPNLAAILNQGAFNLGNASGAWFGGIAISSGLSYTAIPWVGVVLALAALGVTLLSTTLQRRQTQRQQAEMECGMA
ncbi:DHA1 family MFS transporter [Skermanella stibiiresistens SB22]|uniref:DHA1 family MFS transporter n=1 Tax=Skermanella stibiiresistens SB22 TaxID=1385369 RepID=W9H1M6_9PROT|nr:MFS transporter [Skermanella stibiiresistens]EWY37633.1 DHA1 family MFS transporter [Skermanella stibiiresistens SB22]